MAYGLHWEWRGFGTPDGLSVQRLSELAFPSRTEAVVDRYLWLPESRINVKLRAWSGGRSLKLKRLLDADAQLGVQLWAEYPEDDHSLPMAAEAAARVLVELGVPPMRASRPVGDEALIHHITGALPAARIVTVLKRRASVALDVGDTVVRVERVEISEPELITSIGIEDLAGLDRDSSPPLLERARAAVCNARDRLHLDLPARSYVEAVTAWAMGASALSAG
jgi:hypothetical protein